MSCPSLGFWSHCALALALLLSSCGSAPTPGQGTSPGQRGTQTALPTPPTSPVSAPNQPLPPSPEPGATRPLETAQPATALLAGGCFWGMEDILRQVPGVVDTEVGYTGGHLANPTYPDMRTGRTGHAEAIRIRFHRDQVSYGELLDLFFRMHDPTTKNRQGNDVGTQYRSAIFYLDAEQEAMAHEAIARATASGRWKRPIVTEVTAASTFWPAEDYHQDYLIKNPGGYTCHWIRD